eukprot:CAMPEP_0171951808 /NCGR_PEP_ID=MMETSP0993-20121228/85731_1 /TAXON_ID=483369 /ORGANISM="non described non described, Strain CCMP2098" /LENGTH=179 /DNA_ID=CAMNT_0012597027 /DNA_START=38 /DNA_END=577 /DNA_ORIENTATION=+
MSLSDKTIRRIGMALWSIPMGVTFNDNVASCSWVRDGVAIEPTLPIGGPLSLDVCFYLRRQIAGKYAVQDVVVLGSPLKPEKKMAQRIAALEGDWVRRKTKNATDWRPQNSEIIRRGNCWLEHDEKVGEEGRAVSSDNEEVSTEDSRTFGQVPLALVEGRVAGVMRVQIGLPIISILTV